MKNQTTSLAGSKITNEEVEQILGAISKSSARK